MQTVWIFALKLGGKMIQLNSFKDFIHMLL